MRVGILALLQESNTFVSARTTLAAFERDLLLEGDQFRQQLADAHHEVGGFFEGLECNSIQAVPLFAARALPYGPIDRATFDRLMEMLMGNVERAGRLDGYLVAPHGATVAESYADADGHWLALLRKYAGEQVPIIGTIDPHANLSCAMVEATDALIAYRTNPHIDQRARGIEAATLLASTLRGEIQPVQALAAPPMLINIGCQRSCDPPALALLHAAETAAKQPGVISTSVVYGFAYADVHELSSAIVCVTDNDQRQAQRVADELALRMWSDRLAFDQSYPNVEAALNQAMQLDGAVCMLDMGDNIGAGSPGDGTVLVNAIHGRPCGPAFACLCDANSVQVACAIAPGSHFTAAVGAKTDSLHGEPLEAEFEVVSIHDGLFAEPEPRHGGISTFDMGPTAIVQTDTGLTVQLTSNRVAPFSLVQLTSCGLDPSSFKLLVAKGVNAPLAAYQSVCAHAIRVDTPGVTAADPRRFTFHQRRRPMFPFEDDAQYLPTTAKDIASGRG
jgi:microcystin degradation protein MlrC